MLGSFRVFPPCPTPSAEAAAEMYAPLLEAATRWVLNPPPIFDELMEKDSNFVELRFTLKPDFPKEVLQADLADLFVEGTTKYWRIFSRRSPVSGFSPTFLSAKTEKELKVRW